MRKIVILILAVLALGACTKEKVQHPALELVGLYQLDSLHGLKFDLSGIVQRDDTVYIIADKPWNKFLYGINFNESSFEVISKQNLQFQDKLDLEGIDHCDGITYLVNERQGLVYGYADPTNIQILDINFDSLGLDPRNWGNAGWEGVTSDCDAGVLYLIKEREPRNIYVVKTDTWKIIDTFNIPETESNDFSDAKFENGFLYVIERNGNFITKINSKTKEVASKYHYQDIASNSKGKLFGPTEFGMGEALLLTESEIWIGLDNNGLKVTEYAEKTYGLTGKSPVIIKFKRPEGF